METRKRPVKFKFLKSLSNNLFNLFKKNAIISTCTEYASEFRYQIP